MRTLLSVICCTAFLLSQQIAVAKPTDLAEGAKLYGQNNLRGALPLFQRAVESEYRSSGAAYYYLANTLLRLNRQSEAMRAYEKAAQLDPSGTYGSYANQVLSRLGGKKVAPAAAPDTAAAPDATPGSDTPVKADEGEVRKLSAQFPRLPQLSKESPDVSTVLGWQDTEKSNYVTDATDRKARATKTLEEAQALLKRVEQQAKNGLNISKGSKESDSDFENRRKASQAVIEAALAPYKKHVEACEKNLEKENQLLESCSTARKNIRGY